MKAYENIGALIAVGDIRVLLTAPGNRGKGPKGTDVHFHEPSYKGGRDLWRGSAKSNKIEFNLSQ